MIETPIYYQLEAKELVEDFRAKMGDAGFDIRMSEEKAIECALICVDKLIDCLPSVNDRPPSRQNPYIYTSKYWKEVKREINKL
tara:strand:+ start:564 stop:815 length:252 start_codon:yes stop_codon:yes gene_type:complete